MEIGSFLTILRVGQVIFMELSGCDDVLNLRHVKKQSKNIAFLFVMDTIAISQENSLDTASIITLY